MSAAMEPAQLGRYVIQSELGRGAMGVVYKALDSVLERAVAVKTVNISLEREHADKYEKRFYQEAKAAGGLNHPNIVTIHDVGKHGEVVFMAMEYIEGVELRTLIGEGRPLRVAQMIAKPVEERYQDAAEVARDLRECERHLAGVARVDPAAATRTLPLKPAAVAPLPPQPTLVAADAKTSVLAQSVARTREADR